MTNVHAISPFAPAGCAGSYQGETHPMPRCPVCRAELPDGADYCLAGKMIEYGRTVGFHGCQPIRIDVVDTGMKRATHKIKTDRQLEVAAQVARRR